MESLIRSPVVLAQARPLASAHVQTNALTIELSAEHTRTNDEQRPEQKTSPADQDFLVRVQLQVEKRVSEIHQAAQQRGFEAGYADGLSKGQEKVRQEFEIAERSQREALRELSDSLTSAMESVTGNLTELAAKLAWVAVCKVLGQGVVDPVHIRQIVQQVVAHVDHSHQLKVRLHPHAWSVMSQTEVAKASVGAGVEWIADNSLKYGGAVIEGAFGTIDATLETQLTRLHAILLGNANERPCSA